AAVVRRGLERVADALGLIPLSGAPARPPRRAPARALAPRPVGFRAAGVFVLMIVSAGASTLMLRDAAVSQVLEYGPRISAWLDTPGGLAVGADGSIYLADSHRHVIRRVDARTLAARPV